MPMLTNVSPQHTLPLHMNRRMICQVNTRILNEASTNDRDNTKRDRRPEHPPERERVSILERLRNSRLDCGCDARHSRESARDTHGVLDSRGDELGEVGGIEAVRDGGGGDALGHFSGYDAVQDGVENVVAYAGAAEGAD
jgi:hypothetical protein